MKLQAKQRLIATEELTPKQEAIDLNDNGVVDGDDLKKLREGAKVESAKQRLIASQPVMAADAKQVLRNVKVVLSQRLANWLNNLARYATHAEQEKFAKLIEQGTPAGGVDDFVKGPTDAICKEILKVAKWHIQQAVTRDGVDHGDVAMHLDDACQTIEIARALNRGKIAAAKEKAHQMDTATRDALPNSFWRFVDAKKS
jgi:hypothetical protein